MWRQKTYYVYIVTNQNHTTLYVGITGDIQKRIFQHRNMIGSSFTRKYKCTKLVYVECFEYVYDALEREKQIKKYRRQKKKRLIENMNSKWIDLHDSFL